MARPELVERAIAENWGQADARRAVAAWNVMFQDDSFGHQLERQLRQARKQVLQVDPEHVAASTLIEVHRLLRALQRLVKKNSAPTD